MSNDQRRKILTSFTLYLGSFKLILHHIFLKSQQIILHYQSIHFPLKQITRLFRLGQKTSIPACFLTPLFPNPWPSGITGASRMYADASRQSWSKTCLCSRWSPRPWTKCMRQSRVRMPTSKKKCCSKVEPTVWVNEVPVFSSNRRCFWSCSCWACGWNQWPWWQRL